jgi:hypothetical protein
LPVPWLGRPLNVSCCGLLLYSESPASTIIDDSSDSFRPWLEHAGLQGQLGIRMPQHGASYSTLTEHIVVG